MRFVSAPNVFEDSSVRSHFAQVQVSASRLLFLQSDKMGKTLPKHKLDARLTRKTMCKRELTIVHRLRKILMLPVSSIATAVNRDKSTIYAALRRNQNANLARLGRPPAMTNAQVYSVIRTLRAMVKNAAAHREVTLKMVVKKSKCKASMITVYRELKRRNIKFRKLWCKPILTTEDKLNRFDFSKKYRKKPKAWWLKEVRMHKDIKNFPCYVNQKAREYAAMRQVRGAYRLPGQGLGEAYVVANKEWRYNPGVAAAKIFAGVGAGRVMLWHLLPK